MKVAKEIQYGILLALYLQRSGKAQISDIAEELKLSRSFLTKVARKMLKKGLLDTCDKHIGEYELNRNILIKEIFLVFSSLSLVDDFNGIGGPEFRAFGSILRSLRVSMNPIMNKSVASINKELAANEVAQREKAVETGMVQ